MGKGKQRKFDAIAKMPHVFQNPSYHDKQVIDYKGQHVELMGRWNKEVFKNENPIVLELACGQGEYTVSLAENDKDKNYIGVDIKGARIFQGAKKVEDKGLSNAAFLRTRIEKITDFFAAQEVQEIWIVFPDPFPKDRHAKHRLTSPRFLDRYREILKPGGIIHLKTDSTLLFEYTLEVLKEQRITPLIVERDIRKNPSSNPQVNRVTTYYEGMHIEAGRTIDYLTFSL